MSVRSALATAAMLVAAPVVAQETKPSAPVETSQTTTTTIAGTVDANGVIHPTSVTASSQTNTRPDLSRFTPTLWNIFGQQLLEMRKGVARIDKENRANSPVEPVTSSPVGPVEGNSSERSVNKGIISASTNVDASNIPGGSINSTTNNYSNGTGANASSGNAYGTNSTTSTSPRERQPDALKQLENLAKGALQFVQTPVEIPGTTRNNTKNVIKTTTVTTSVGATFDNNGQLVPSGPVTVSVSSDSRPERAISSTNARFTSVYSNNSMGRCDSDTSACSVGGSTTGSSSTSSANVSGITNSNTVSGKAAGESSRPSGSNSTTITSSSPAPM